MAALELVSHSQADQAPELSLEARLQAELGLAPDQKVSWLDAINVHDFLPYENIEVGGHMLVQYLVDGSDGKIGEIRVNDHNRPLSSDLIIDIGLIAVQKEQAARQRELLDQQTKFLIRGQSDVQRAPGYIIRTVCTFVDEALIPIQQEPQPVAEEAHLVTAA